MLLLYYMTLFVLGPFISFIMSCDSVTVTVTYNITLTPSLKSQNKNKIKMRKELKIIRVYYLQL